jgi:hypothetical protein
MPGYCFCDLKKMSCRGRHDPRGKFFSKNLSTALDIGFLFTYVSTAVMGTHRQAQGRLHGKV